MSPPSTESWGLLIPGRPVTPSDGAAQQYHRIGPIATQKLLTFGNGTCIQFGPDDPIDEFEPDIHPFKDQVALIDKSIRDCKAVRGRYEQSGETASTAEFNNFRENMVPPALVSIVNVGGAPYIQVPSRFGTLTNLISIYSLSNKSDVPGLSHPDSSDPRYGVINKPFPPPGAPTAPSGHSFPNGRAGRNERERGRLIKRKYQNGEHHHEGYRHDERSLSPVRRHHGPPALLPSPFPNPDPSPSMYPSGSFPVDAFAHSSFPLAGGSFPVARPPQIYATNPSTRPGSGAAPSPAPASFLPLRTASLPPLTLSEVEALQHVQHHMRQLYLGPRPSSAGPSAASVLAPAGPRGYLPRRSSSVGARPRFE